MNELLKIEEKESFLSFIPRRFNYFIYTYAVVGIMSYALSYFFIEEIKIKKLFIKNKEGEIKLKYEISKIVKQIKSRFTILIIVSLVLTIISFIYISCFNIVYPNTKEEWYKSSIFLFIITQIINLLITFVESSIRYIAIKCNSEKFFKLSQYLI